MNNPSAVKKLGTMSWLYKKMQESGQSAKNAAQRAYAGAKSVATAPVNYVFGKEESKAKTNFYNAAKQWALLAALLGAQAYLYYKALPGEMRHREEENLRDQLSGLEPGERVHYDLLGPDDQKKYIEELRKKMW